MPGSSATADAAILDIARRQHGVVSRKQLLAAGLSSRAVQYRLHTDRVRRVHRGVYAVGPVTGTHQREMAAILACGDGCYLGHRSAAACWQLLAPPAGAVAVVTARDIRTRDGGIRVHRVSRLEGDEVTRKDHLALTTPARTLMDLAGCASPGELERALARALRDGLTKPDEIRRLLDRYSRRPGRGILTGLLDSDAGPAFTRSEAERAFLELVRSAGLPSPRSNTVVRGLEVDCLWPEELLVVEIDGRTYHRGARAFERDRDRDAALVSAGYRVMRVTWKQITQEPRRVLVRVAAALARGDGG